MPIPSSLEKARPRARAAPATARRREPSRRQRSWQMSAETPKRRRDHDVAIGDEPHGRPARIIHREEQGGDRRDPGRAQHPPVKNRHGGHHRAQPEQALGVHQHRRVRPERVIEPVGQDRQGLEKLGLQGRVGPPGEHPDIHDPARSAPGRRGRTGTSRREARAARGTATPEHDRPVIIIVEDPAGPQGRQREQDRQRRHDQGKITRPRQRR